MRDRRLCRTPPGRAFVCVPSIAERSRPQCRHRQPQKYLRRPISANDALRPRSGPSRLRHAEVASRTSTAPIRAQPTSKPSATSARNLVSIVCCTMDSPTPVVRKVRQTNSTSGANSRLNSGTTKSSNIGRNSRGGPGSMMSQLFELRGWRMENGRWRLRFSAILHLQSSILVLFLLHRQPRCSAVMILKNHRAFRHERLHPCAPASVDRAVKIIFDCVQNRVVSHLVFC